MLTRDLLLNILTGMMRTILTFYTYLVDVCPYVIHFVIPYFLILFAYLVGSIPIGVLLARLKGKDPRKTGSGNIGATNVMRSAGKVLGILTLIGDVLKGFVPTWIAIQLGMPAFIIALVGLAVFSGHLFPVFLKFKGGKGVATGAGVYLAISPPVILISFVIFIIVFLIWKYVSLGSLVGTGIIPFSFFLFKTPTEYILFSLLIACGVFMKHKDNIKRLLAGTESKVSLGEKS
jgi:glycerol-3-phosphate acyltransferase PlsY